MIRTEHAHLTTAAATHPGMTGKINEDRYAVSAFQAGDEPVLLAVLCDGIGGHQAGEVAAELAVEIISEVVADSDGTDPLKILDEAIVESSERIRELAESSPSYHGMGATCALAWVQGKRLYTGTVGDSRIYLLRGGVLRQLSTDHTWIQEALEGGFIRPDQVKGHPNSHVIRRYLGSPNPPRLDHRLRLNGSENDKNALANQGLLLQPKDRLLLCSDGLTDLVEREEIEDILRRQPLQSAADALVQLANARGGHDNITLVVAEVPPPPPRKLSFKPLVLGCMVLVLVSALIAVAILGALWWQQRSGAPSPTPALWEQSLTPPPGAPGLATAAPTASLQPGATLTPSLTPILLPAPLEDGATLTPWPTNPPPSVP